MTAVHHLAVIGITGKILTDLRRRLYDELLRDTSRDTFLSDSDNCRLFEIRSRCSHENREKTRIGARDIPTQNTMHLFPSIRSRIPYSDTTRHT